MFEQCKLALTQVNIPLFTAAKHIWPRAKTLLKGAREFDDTFKSLSHDAWHLPRRYETKNDKIKPTSSHYPCVGREICKRIPQSRLLGMK